jgi:hypothetical protein
MADRDSVNLKHFTSRAQKPQSKKIMQTPKSSGDINIYVQFDSNLGNDSAEINPGRFNYLGTSPSWTSYSQCGARRNNMSGMASAFHA